MADKKTSSIEKYRDWTFIIYPESIPTDFVSRLEKLGRPIAISPLHDKDEKEYKKIEELTEEEQTVIKNGGKVYKKPHYHVLYIAANPVAGESVRKKVKRVLGDKALSHMEVVDSIQNIYQYLTHESKDAIAKKKYKYDKKDIIHINDFDIDRYVYLDEREKRELKNNLLDLIRHERLVNIADLFGYLELKGEEIGITNLKDVNDVITSSTAGFRLWFDANYQNGWRPTYVDSVDPMTGEVKEGKKND